MQIQATWEHCIEKKIGWKPLVPMVAALALSASIIPSFAQAQDSFSKTIGGQNISVETSLNQRVTRLSDVTGLSPNRVWIESFDAQGRTIEIDGPLDGRTDLTRVDWSADSRTKTITNSMGHISRFDYDVGGRVTVYTDPNGGETRFSYDSAGRILSISKWANTAAPEITQLGWTDDGYLSQVILPDGSSLANLVTDDGYFTDDVKNIFSDIAHWMAQDSLTAYLPVVDSSATSDLPRRLLGDNMLEITLNEEGRITSGTDASGQSLRFTYDDPTGHLKSFTDSRGVETRLTNNGFGDVLREETMERGAIDNVYDVAGRLIRQDRAGGLVLKREHDALGRTTRVVYKERGVDRKVHRYTYDTCENGVGRLCRVNTDGIITRYSYTPRGDLSQSRVRYEDGRVQNTGYRYTSIGQLSVIRYPTGLNVRYHYNEEGFVRRVTGKYETGDDKEVFVIAKNINVDPETARLNGLTFGNGLRTKWAYDLDGELKSRTVLNKGVPQARDRYRYDDRGNINAINRLEPTLSQSFDYDAMDRLISEQRPQAKDSALDRDYSYDAAGNRTGLTKDSRTISYSYAPDANTLVKIGRKGLAYDERGNMMQDRSGSRQFDYDVTNRMTAFYKRGKLKASYDYNHEGQRISKVLHGKTDKDYQTLLMSYTPTGWLLSEHGQRADKAASFARDYVWLGDRPLAQIERRIRSDGATKKARITFIHTDHLNTPEWGSDADGNHVWQWTRDAFGAVKPDRDPDGDGVNTTIRLRFPGQYADRDSGLFYNHNRDYDPSLGRYIQSDPIGLSGGVNRYVYVNGNPIRYIDPDGLEKVDCTGSRIKKTRADCETIMPMTCIGNCSSAFYATPSHGGGTRVVTNTTRHVGGECYTGGCTAFGVRERNYFDPSEFRFASGMQGYGITRYAQLGPIDPRFLITDGGCIINSGLSFCLRKQRYKVWADNIELCRVTIFARAAVAALESLSTPRFLTGYTSSGYDFLERVSASLEQANMVAFNALLSGLAVPGVTTAPDGIDRGMVRFEQSIVQQALDGFRVTNVVEYNSLISQSNVLLNSVFGQNIYSHLEVAKDRLGRDIDFANQSDREEIGYALVERLASEGCD